MLLWIAMAALAAATALALLAPFYRAGPVVAAGGASAIFRDQLGEIDRDVADGSIGRAEADAARAEVARRLIHEEQAVSAQIAAERRPGRLVPALVVLMPIAALAFYLAIGSPYMPGQPLTSRPEAIARQELLGLVAKVEAHLDEKPDDGQGWEVLAPVYERLGRFDDAVRAYGNAVRLLGSTAAREADLGEAIVRANDGTVTGEAEAAFRRAADLAPDDPRPQFYVALALGQAGKRDEAIAAWQALLAKAPADASWVPVAQQQLAMLQASGPTAADVNAAAGLSPEQRQAMVEGMVATLAERLKVEPNDADGWARLIRSYVVLGRQDDARQALADAHAALSDPSRRAVVDAAASDAGLTVKDTP